MQDRFVTQNPKAPGGRALFIVNPTMKSQEGHFYNYDTAIAVAAGAHFSTIAIYADRQFIVPADAPCVIHPVLNIIPISALKTLANRIFGLLRHVRPASKAAEHHANASVLPEVPSRMIDLGRVLNGADVMLGLARVLLAQRRHRHTSVDILIEYAHIGEIYAVRLISRWSALLAGAPVTFHMVMRSTPAMMFPRGQVSDSFHRAMHALVAQALPPVRFYTDSEKLTQDYRALYANPAKPQQFITLPIPVLLTSEVQKSEQGQGVTVSMLGPPRIEKGFDELPAIYDALSAFPNITLAVQLAKNPADPRVAERTRWFNDKAAAGGAVKLRALEGPAPEPLYFSWFGQTDVLLLPYISPRYAQSTSGVFVEALYFITPIITTSGTWMADQVAIARAQGLHIGEEIDSIPAMGEALARILADLPRYRRDMQTYLAQWMRFHNVNTLVDMLIEPWETAKSA
jgi:hypothetical protein